MANDDTKVVDLSPQQRRQLCDSQACFFGGYGARLTCANGPAVTLSSSRSACVNTLPTQAGCQATLADLRRCMAALEKSPCVSTFLAGDACDAVTSFDCLTFTPSALSAGYVELGAMTATRAAH